MKKVLVRILIAFFVTAFVVSVAGNFIGFQFVYKAFDKYNDARLDPIGELRWKLSEKANGHHEVVIIGDSHAWNWTYPGTDVLNLGIPSQTAVQIKLRSDQYTELSGNRLIIFAGGNDMKSISSNLDRKDEIIDSCLSAIRGIIDNHKERFKEIVLVTIPPAFKIPFEYRVIYDPAVGEAHLEINEGIRELAKARNVRLVDAYSILKPKLGREKLSIDGLHLNNTSYGYLESALKTAD